MQIEIDPEVGAAASLLQANFSADRLVAVAEGLARLAPALWGHHPAAQPAMLAELRPQSITPSEPGRRSTATE